MGTESTRLGTPWLKIVSSGDQEGSHSNESVPCWHVVEILKPQDPGRLNLCPRPWHKVMIHHPLQNIVTVITRRVVFWNDANGSAFVLSPVGSEGLENHPMVVEDCTVLLSLSHHGCHPHPHYHDTTSSVWNSASHWGMRIASLAF